MRAARAGPVLRGQRFAMSKFSGALRWQPVKGQCRLVCSHLNKQFYIEQHCTSSQHALQLENILC